MVIVKEVFSERKQFGGSEIFKDSKLEQAVKAMLERCGENPDAPRMIDPQTTKTNRYKV